MLRKNVLFRIISAMSLGEVWKRINSGKQVESADNNGFAFIVLFLLSSPKCHLILL
jgi:hypothetical protein